MSGILLERIGVVRRRLRRQQLAVAAARVALAALGLIGGFYLIDRVVVAPLADSALADVAARGVLVAVALALLAWAMLSTLVRELRTQRSDDELGMAIERAHPGLDARLISTVQLVRGLEQSEARGERPAASSALILALARETAERCASLDFGAIIDHRAARRLFASALIALALALALCCWQRATALVLFQRLLLAQACYPTATGIERVTAPGRVGQGDPVAIEIELDPGRLLPPAASVEIHPQVGADAVIALQRIDDALGGARYRGILPHALESFSFRPSAYDARWPSWIPVEVIPRPALGALRLECGFPAYLARAPESTSVGDLRVPVETTVQIHAAATKPLIGATLLVRSKVHRSGSTVAATVERVLPLTLDADRTGIEGGFTIDGDGTYAIRLHDRDGLDNGDPIGYAISAIPDLPPVITIQFPGHDKLATPSAQWPIRFTVKDDHGIVRGWIKYQIERGDDLGPSPDQSGASAASSGPGAVGSGASAAAGADAAGAARAGAAATDEPTIHKIEITGLASPGELEVRREVIINLAKLHVEEGMRLVYWIEAEDNRRPEPNRGTSPRYAFSVVSQASLTERFEHEKSQLLGGIETIRDRQSEMKNAVDTVRKAAP